MFFISESSFIQNHSNLYHLFHECSGREYVILKQLDAIMAEHFGPNLPPISQLEKRVELALINSHPLLGNAGPQPHNVIPIGGMHIKDVKPLSNVSLIFLF